MAIEKFEPGPTGFVLVEKGKIVGHISLGGRELLMPIGSKTMLFEMHDWHGPIPLNKKTKQGLEKIPDSFWDAHERWDLGGQLVDGDLCIVRAWCSKCGGSGCEIEMLSKCTGEITGPCEACGGSKLEERKI